MSNTILDAIWRFPVKGFSGQKLRSTDLRAGAGIPHDRRFAVTDGTLDTGSWMPARSFFINAYKDGLSKFEIVFDDAVVCLTNTDGARVEFRPDDSDSLEAANKKIAELMEPVGFDHALPAPKIVERKGVVANWDYPDTPISIINVASVNEISATLSADLEPRRFRGNLVISGIPAWQEFSWMGKRIRIGEAELEIHRPIDRCPTPGVNPDTGERDVEVTKGIQEHFGHVFCGMYANVVKAGQIDEGSTIEVIGDAEMSWQAAADPENASDYRLWARTCEIVEYEICKAGTNIVLQSATPWPLPNARPGQRLRIHLGAGQWAIEYIVAISPEKFHLTIEDSQTEDPVTMRLRNGMKLGDLLIVSGPFGKG